MQGKQRIYFIFSILVLLFALLNPTVSAQGLAGDGLVDGLSNPSQHNQSTQADTEKLRSPQRSDSTSDRYIVVMKPTTRVAQNRQGIERAVAASGGRVQTFFTEALNGFSAELPPEALKQLLADPDVDFIEPDSIVSINDDWASPALVDAFGSQSGPVWGLDRIDQRDLPLDGFYAYDSTAGDVHAYLVDTGILATHDEFSGRIGNGFTSILDGAGTSDCNGHGTHVAGTIGGTTYGVAKGVTIHPVRVLNCDGSGTLSGVIAGLDWIINNGLAPGVVNMSLGNDDPTDDILDLAVNNVIDAGFSVVVAAGNSGADACLTSPARVADAITVGATNSSDSRASFSNIGTCLDLFAPGVYIESASISSNSTSVIYSGTSMAAPHVAGIAALYLQENQTALPSVVAQAITQNATEAVLTNLGTGSPNLLLFLDRGPIPLQPTGIIIGGTPEFVWARVAGATEYKVELLEGTSAVPVETLIIQDEVCSTTTCSVVSEYLFNPEVGQYSWRVQESYEIDQWESFTDALDFTYVEPFYTFLPLINND